MVSGHHGIKQEIHDKISRESTKLWNQTVNFKIAHSLGGDNGDIRKYFELKENVGTTYQPVCDSAKALLREQFVGLHVYIKKEERSNIGKLHN